ncbi:MAG: hypothetical protein IJ792_02755, partial [Oscillospiraceae bacterium]|nr:hypothetical protein [Oscillospiraceae bacterium]
ITMEEVVKLAEPDEITFLQRLGQNFMWGLDNVVEFLQDLVIWLAYNFIGILVLAVVVVVIVVVARKRKQRRIKQYMAQRPAPAPAPAPVPQKNEHKN